MLKVSPQKPPNYDKILERFPTIKDQPVVFTYGDTIYNVPEDRVVPAHLMVHEEIHFKQQGDDPEGWYEKYLKDDDFRLDQELMAYAAQYKFCLEHLLRKDADKMLDRFAHDLSSEVYGSIINFHKAHANIRNLAKTINA